nr:MAG TPA: hypothetical protein [Caudoviricetes sp.]
MINPQIPCCLRKTEKKGIKSPFLCLTLLN